MDTLASHWLWTDWPNLSMSSSFERKTKQWTTLRTLLQKQLLMVTKSRSYEQILHQCLQTINRSLHGSSRREFGRNWVRRTHSTKMDSWNAMFKRYATWQRPRCILQDFRSHIGQRPYYGQDMHGIASRDGITRISHPMKPLQVGMLKYPNYIHSDVRYSQNRWKIWAQNLIQKWKILFS